MTKEEAQKLEELFDGGHLVLIDAGPYSDGPINCIFEEIAGPNKGKHVYSSDVFTDRLLDDVHTYDVEVYAPALDKWEPMKESMDQDRRDAWEHTLWAQEEATKCP